MGPSQWFHHVIQQLYVSAPSTVNTDYFLFLIGQPILMFSVVVIVTLWLLYLTSDHHTVKKIKLSLPVVHDIHSCERIQWKVKLTNLLVGYSFLYKPFMYVPPQRVLFLRCLGMKTGFRLYFHQFWFGIGYGFDKTTGFVVSKFQMNKKERVICECEIDLKNVGILI